MARAGGTGSGTGAPSIPRSSTRHCASSALGPSGETTFFDRRRGPRATSGMAPGDASVAASGMRGNSSARSSHAGCWVKGEKRYSLCGGVPWSVRSFVMPAGSSLPYRSHRLAEPLEGDGVGDVVVLSEHRRRHGHRVEDGPLPPLLRRPGTSGSGARRPPRQEILVSAPRARTGTRLPVAKARNRSPLPSRDIVLCAPPRARCAAPPARAAARDRGASVAINGEHASLRRGASGTGRRSRISCPTGTPSTRSSPRAPKFACTMAPTVNPPAASGRTRDAVTDTALEIVADQSRSRRRPPLRRQEPSAACSAASRTSSADTCSPRMSFERAVVAFADDRCHRGLVHADARIAPEHVLRSPYRARGPRRGVLVKTMGVPRTPNSLT